MKKIKIYLEASALWNLYYNESGGKIIEYCLNNDKLNIVSSIWSYLELERAIKKRSNQNELTDDEASQLRVFIDTDLKKLSINKKLIFLPVSNDDIQLAKKFINVYNLYASDALHLVTAIKAKSYAIFVDDYHFERLSKEIEIDYQLKIIPTSFKIKKINNLLNI